MNTMTRTGTLLLAAIFTVSFSGVAAASSGSWANRSGQMREHASLGSTVAERHGSGRNFKFGEKQKHNEQSSRKSMKNHTGNRKGGGDHRAGGKGTGHGWKQYNGKQQYKSDRDGKRDNMKSRGRDQRGYESGGVGKTGGRAWYRSR